MKEKVSIAGGIIMVLIGPGCSKLATSLVNILLKFQTLFSKITPIFFVEKKCETAKAPLFFLQKISVYLVIKS